jgi:hypothetical protein
VLEVVVAVVSYLPMQRLRPVELVALAVVAMDYLQRFRPV